VALRSAARLDLAAALDLTPKVLAQIGPARRDDAARLARQLRHQAPEAAVGAALEGDLAAAAGRWADAATAYREALARRETASLTDRLQTALRRSAAGERPRLTRGLTPDSGPPATAAMRPW
jgi:predicted negative regulator of RcsB-dependent stress response